MMYEMCGHARCLTWLDANGGDDGNDDDAGAPARASAKETNTPPSRTRERERDRSVGGSLHTPSSKPCSQLLLPGELARLEQAVQRRHAQEDQDLRRVGRVQVGGHGVVERLGQEALLFGLFFRFWRRFCLFSFCFGFVTVLDSMGERGERDRLC
jgi:hypothetical protein